MIVCEFDVDQQDITLKSKPVMANSSNMYLQLKFNFKNHDWDDLAKFVICHTEKENYLLALEDNTVMIPDYCIHQRWLRFTLYGENTETCVRITCKQQELVLLESNYTKDTSSTCPDYNPDAFVIILERLDRVDRDLEDRYTKNEVYNKIETDELLLTKSDVGHSHTVSDLTDFNENVGLEIKASFRQLANRIRTGDG